jgi:hypothetical protein
MRPQKGLALGAIHQNGVDTGVDFYMRREAGAAGSHYTCRLNGGNNFFTYILSQLVRPLFFHQTMEKPSTSTQRR